MEEQFVYHILQDNGKWYIFQESGRTGYVARINIPYDTFDEAREVVRKATGFYERMDELAERFSKFLGNKK